MTWSMWVALLGDQPNLNGSSVRIFDKKLEYILQCKSMECLECIQENFKCYSFLSYTHLETNRHTNTYTWTHTPTFTKQLMDAYFLTTGYANVLKPNANWLRRQKYSTTIWLWNTKQTWNRVQQILFPTVNYFHRPTCQITCAKICIRVWMGDSLRHKVTQLSMWSGISRQL